MQIEVINDNNEKVQKTLYESEFMNWTLLDLIDPKDLETVLIGVLGEMETDLKGYKGTNKAFKAIKETKRSFILNNIDLIKDKCNIKDMEVSFDQKNDNLNKLGLELHIAIQAPLFNSFDFWKVNKEDKRLKLKLNIERIKSMLKTIEVAKNANKKEFEGFKV